MATSPEYVRLANSASRPLTDEIFDAVRDAVLVVDTRRKHLPVVLANAAARRCFLGSAEVGSLVDASLYSFLGSATDAALEAASGLPRRGKSGISRVLPWRLPDREASVATELKVLASAPAQQLLMLSFSEPAADAAAEFGISAAIEHTPLDLLILDKELTVTYANAGAMRTAGTTDEIRGLSALILTPTSAIPREVFTAALDGQRFHDDAIAVTAPGESVRWFEVDVQPLEDETGILGVAVLSLEVTERRVHARAVQGSERRLTALTEHACDIIMIVGRDAQIHYVSGGIRNALGYEPEERRAMTLFAVIHPDDVDALRAKYGELISGLETVFTQQYRARHRDGTYRWMEATYVSALESPLINGVVVNSRDITEARQAESRLAQREEVFRLAAEAVHGIIFEWDLSQEVIHRSRGVHDVLGLEPQEVRSLAAWEERVHPLDLPGYREKIAAAWHGARGWTVAYRIRDIRGRYRSLLERALIQRSPGGDAQRAIGCCVDVSDIKQLTDLLGETQRAARIGGWEYSYTTRELEWTDGMYVIYDATPGEFEVSWHAMMAQCTPESRVRLNDAIDRASGGECRMDLELEIVTLKSQRLWVRLIGTIERLDGRPFRAYGSMQNIQAQKSAQIALENSMDWLKLSMSMAHMHAWRWDRVSDTLEFAIVDGEVVHLPKVFPGMKKLMSRVHRKDRVAVRRAIDEAFERHTDVYQEFRMRSQDGRYRVYVAVARPLYDRTNQPNGLVGVTQDVTDRHEADVRLRRSEEVLRTTTASTVDTLILIDRDLRIRFINHDICALRVEDLIGSDVSVALPVTARETVIEKLRQVFATGESAAYEFEVRARGGTEYFENRAVLVKEAGIGNGLSITMSNITERKRMEQEILDVASRERQAIGRDLHDGLGQELTGVALMLRGLATRFKSHSPDATAQVDEIVQLVNQSIDTARALARGLMPVNTEGGGLSAAVRTLVDRSRELYGFDVTLKANVTDELTLSETTASHLYRIAQEALTNAARHGRASKVTVRLIITSAKFVLRIADDGVGLGSSVKSPSGMGLKIMKYRASMVGARFDIAPNHPSGTVVSVTGKRAPEATAVESAQET